MSSSFSYRFSESLQFNLEIFNIIAVFDLIRQFIPKYITRLAKKKKKKKKIPIV